MHKELERTYSGNGNGSQWYAMCVVYKRWPMLPDIGSTETESLSIVAFQSVASRKGGMKEEGRRDGFSYLTDQFHTLIAITFMMSFLNVVPRISWL